MEIEDWRLVKMCSNFTIQIYESLKVSEISEKLKIEYTTRSHGKRYDDVKIHYLTLKNNEETKYQISSLSPLTYYIETNLIKIYKDIFNYSETKGTMRTGNDDWENSNEFIVSFDETENKLHEHKIVNNNKKINLFNSNYLILLSSLRFINLENTESDKIEYNKCKILFENGIANTIECYKKSEIKSMTIYCASQIITEAIIKIISLRIKDLMSNTLDSIKNWTYSQKHERDEFEKKLNTCVEKVKHERGFNTFSYLKFNCLNLNMHFLTDSENLTFICPINSYFNDPYVFKISLDEIYRIEKEIKERIQYNIISHIIVLSIKL